MIVHFVIIKPVKIMEIKEMKEAYIQTIFSWCYPEPYKQYNMPSLSIAKEKGYGILDPKQRYMFHTLCEQDVCIGYFRTYEKEGKTFLGIALQPELCGKGVGKQAIRQILVYYATHLSSLYLEVDIQNIRAICCYLSSGFLKTQIYQKKTPTHQMRTYLEMRFTF